MAVGFIHSYANPAHEERAREILSRRLSVPISISAEVSPQMRELERFNTVCANAYVRPQMESYLSRLQSRLKDIAVDCPVFMIHSGGGLVSIGTASKFPVRLVESGPAGGAIFAADIAQSFQLARVVSFDMGGTTAKTCLIDDFQPRTARTLEVARTYRFSKGSGMAISIPVIEMIEIGAGGGSIAWVDAMGRIQVGPESAGSEPGPACYQHGGTRPSVTDADLVLGKIDPGNFAGGKIALSVELAREAISGEVGRFLDLDLQPAAFGICEVVDENMANAARVHAIENGRNIADYTMIAFGGAAPLHASRLCEKLGVERCLVPRGAGVGSAIGFLRTPFGYEALASRVMRLSSFNAADVNALLAELKSSAERFVRAGADGDLVTELTAYMRYAGQGWEIPVTLPDREFADKDGRTIESDFRGSYARFFGRAVEGPEIEIVTWSVRMREVRALPERRTLDTGGKFMSGSECRPVFDAAAGTDLDCVVVDRRKLPAGARLSGPAVIFEEETSTVVTSRFDAVIQTEGSILLVRKGTET